MSLPHGTALEVERRMTPEPERPLPSDPIKWVREDCDEFLWSKQREILRALVEHRKVAVQSCHGIGKSYIASRAAAWWIAGHPKGEAKVVSTAPSGHQVRSILWGELNKAHARAQLPGTISHGQVPEWTIGGEQVAFGRKPADYVNAEQARTQFQGIHARYLLGVLDEGGGVPLWLWQAMETLVTNESCRLLAIGNPDDPTTEFARICSPGQGWHVIAVGAFDTPNFTGEPVPEQLRESLVSKLWVEEREKEWGKQSPLYISKVLGRFPDVADDVIISPRLIREAHERDLSGESLTQPPKVRYGMDVARMGEDETCIYENRRGTIRLVDAWRKSDTAESAQRTAVLLDEYLRWRELTIDEPGLGAGVLDPLRRAGYKVHGFNGGEKAVDPERFANRNAEAWWGFREALEAGQIDLDPADELLAAQLQARKWKLDTSQRRIRIETKDEMLRRGIKSPDRADAAILSWYEGYHVPDPDVVMDWHPDRTPKQTSIAGDLLHLPT